MFRLITCAIIIVLFSPSLIAGGSGAIHPPRTYDDFGDINCEDEMARLDSFAVQLQQVPDATGVIIFYGGVKFRGRLPRRGDAAARAARMKPYLVNRRGIPAERIVVINGGYKADWTAQLWIVPSGMPLPTPGTELKIERVRFRKGTARARDFRCQI
jgi:hypothetical protein